MRNFLKLFKNSWKHYVGIFILAGLVNWFWLFNNNTTITYVFGSLTVDVGIGIILGWLVEYSQRLTGWGVYSEDDIYFSVFGGFSIWFVMAFIKIIGGFYA